MRHSGLQREVFSLYRTALRTAKKKDLLSNIIREDNNSMVSYVRNHVRSLATSIPSSDFERIEFYLRTGKRQLQLFQNKSVQRAQHVQKTTE